MKALSDLQAWYLAQCNGDWEHGSGVTITTLDNPGWSVAIDLAGTTLDGKEFSETGYGLANTPELKFDSNARVLVDDSSYEAAIQFQNDPNWLICSVKENRFEGYGGPEKLEEILITFLRWAAGNDRSYTSGA